MREQLEERLNKLKSELEAGQAMLADMDRKRAELNQTLLRISGAMQVIEELLEGEDTTLPSPESKGDGELIDTP